MLLSSGRITITAFNPRDLAEARELLQDPDVVRHTGFRTIVPDWDLPAILNSWVDQGQQPRGVWKVTASGTEDFLGMTMLKDTELPHPELGYMLVKGQWGKGYATEIARSMLHYGFAQLRLPHIMAGTDKDNVASMRVLTKVGMTRVAEGAIECSRGGGAYFIKSCP